MSENAVFTAEQQNYLQGFALGTDVAKQIRNLPVIADSAAPATSVTVGGASQPASNVIARPEQRHYDAQDRQTAAGGKLCAEEAAKREKNPLDMWDEMQARAASGEFPKGTDVFLQKFHGLFHVAPAQNSYMCRHPASGLREWVPVGLTGMGASFEQDYTKDTSAMAKAISCFNNSSGQGTDIADPVRVATYELETYGRKDAVKAILLLSDGKPNNSATPSVKSSDNYCADAFEAAKAAKAKGIEVYTVGFGLDVQQDHICQDTFGAWKGKSAPDLLAAMATNSTNDNGCPGTENDDGDNYFCLPKTSGASTDLSDVFKKAVAQLSGHSRLVNVD